MATGILSDIEITEQYMEKNIIITDFRQENLGNCSYDVTLGAEYFTCKLPSNSIYDPYSKDSSKSWVLKKAKTFKECVTNHSNFGVQAQCRSWDGSTIKETDLLIVLKPRSTILAHTQEFIGAKRNITTMMKARSSIGRNFLEVCKCDSLGNIGYINRWTMEITNNSDYYIPLVVGSRIAQIVFFWTGDCYYTYDQKQGAKYQAKYSSVDDMQEAWKPQHMLPRLYMDESERSSADTSER